MYFRKTFGHRKKKLLEFNIWDPTVLKTEKFRHWLLTSSRYASHYAKLRLCASFAEILCALPPPHAGFCTWLNLAKEEIILVPSKNITTQTNPQPFKSMLPSSDSADRFIAGASSQSRTEVCLHVKDGQLQSGQDVNISFFLVNLLL